MIIKVAAMPCDKAICFDVIKCTVLFSSRLCNACGIKYSKELKAQRTKEKKKRKNREQKRQIELNKSQSPKAARRYDMRNRGRSPQRKYRDSGSFEFYDDASSARQSEHSGSSDSSD